MLPVSDHVTGHYPPFSQERRSRMVNACDRWSAGDARWWRRRLWRRSEKQGERPHGSGSWRALAQ
eukprot:1462971-Prymnesium_polylepis.1